MSHEALAAGTELLRMGHLRWIGWKLRCAATGLNQNLRERAIFAGVFHTCAICRCRMHWYLLAYCVVIFWYILYKYYQNTAPMFSIRFTYSLTMVWWFFQIHSFPGCSHVHCGDDTSVSVNQSNGIESLFLSIATVSNLVESSPSSRIPLFLTRTNSLS